MKKTINFIKSSNKIHNYKYLYHKTIFNKSNTNVIVTCEKHGDFNVTPNNHLSKKSGCSECKRKTELNFFNFKNKANLKYNNKFEYVDNSYINNKTNMIIICNVHGSYKQTPQTHLETGCKDCNYMNRLMQKRESFISKSNILHNHLYDYSLVNYKGIHEPVDILCEKHGTFQQSPNSHLKGHGCNKCKRSKGELLIAKCLTDNNIDYIIEYKFEDCIFKKQLPFDFYLKDHNICIEYDGRQHYEAIDYFGGESGFKKRKIRDSIKNKYCIDNNINLIRISYLYFDDIIDIILNITKDINHNR